MFKSLYFKIVLILLIFIIAVMCAVAAILINGVTSFYINDFNSQMEDCFEDGGLLMMELDNISYSENSAEEIKGILASYGSILGIDQYRNYYVLNLDGEMLAGSDMILGSELIVTPNIISAINGSGENFTSGGMDFSDWAVRLSSKNEEENDYIIYIKDSLEEMRQLNSSLFTIIFHSMIIGVLIAGILSFFLAKSISLPIQRLTYGTQLVASGEFSNDIEIDSADEIGVLAENFNYMKEKLRATLEEVDGEREKLDTVLSCMKDAVLAFTADGKVLHSNNASMNLFKEELEEGTMTLEQCFERLDLPLIIENNAVRLISADAEAEATKDGFIFRDRICDSRVYDVSFAVIRYMMGKRHAAGCVIVIHDVTARYELDESRREFVANVSHELRTPLTSIKGATETVRMDPEMDEETRDYFLDMVLYESDRMTRIVSDLLTLSRLDNKKTKWNIETFDFKQSVRHLCEVMHPNFEEHKHELTFSCENEIPDVTADRQRIEQVIINVISNAVKYTPDGGHIDVKLRCENNEMVKVVVTDNGIGIPKEDISHLFERFYRVEKSRTQDAGGTGLGLAIAKELVEAHGGSISVDSTVGKGTCVTVAIPAQCKIKA